MTDILGQAETVVLRGERVLRARLVWHTAYGFTAWPVDETRIYEVAWGYAYDGKNGEYDLKAFKADGWIDFLALSVAAMKLYESPGTLLEAPSGLVHIKETFLKYTQLRRSKRGFGCWEFVKDDLVVCCNPLGVTSEPFASKESLAVYVDGELRHSFVTPKAAIDAIRAYREEGFSKRRIRAGLIR